MNGEGLGSGERIPKPRSVEKKQLDIPSQFIYLKFKINEIKINETN